MTVYGLQFVPLRHLFAVGKARVSAFVGLHHLAAAFVGNAGGQRLSVEGDRDGAVAVAVGLYVGKDVDGRARVVEEFKILAGGVYRGVQPLIHIIGGDGVRLPVRDRDVAAQQRVIEGGGYLTDAAARLQGVFLAAGDAVGFLPAAVHRAKADVAVEAEFLVGLDHAGVEDLRRLADVENAVGDGLHRIAVAEPCGVGGDALRVILDKGGGHGGGDVLHDGRELALEIARGQPRLYRGDGRVHVHHGAGLSFKDFEALHVVLVQTRLCVGLRRGRAHGIADGGEAFAEYRVVSGYGEGQTARSALVIDLIQRFLQIRIGFDKGGGQPKLRFAVLDEHIDGGEHGRRGGLELC